MVDITDSAKIRVGVEICTSALRAVSIDRDGKLAARRTTPFDAAGQTMPQLTALIGGLRSDLGDFEHVGVAVPGLVDRDSGRVAFSAHFPEHSNVDLVREIHDTTGLSASIENDANAAAYGEFVLGAGRGSSNFSM